VHHLIDAYDRHILEPGKAPLFWMVATFIVTFAFIRFSVHMIRRQVRWWPGNIDAGGVHVHHLVFGIFMMLAAGIFEFGADPDGSGTVLLAMLFGCGAALTLDEYALWLHLKDVYWAREGRESIDAVVLVGLFMILMFMGISPLGVDDLHDQSREGLALASGIIAVNVVLTSVTLLKGKIATGIVGAFFVPVSLIGAVRLAKPGSPWAHRRYASRPSRRARAEHRYSADRARVGRVKRWAVDHLSGHR
jgi:hypothetical protein